MTILIPFQGYTTISDWWHIPFLLPSCDKGPHITAYMIMRDMLGNLVHWVLIKLFTAENVGH